MEVVMAGALARPAGIDCCAESIVENRRLLQCGVVKYFFSTLLHPLRDERHFALVEISAVPTKARS
jgi:hypothetical protein